ncbi:PREDICTED: multidrug and toxin extrusion protein 1-like [Cyprinodon variegatus]|uniref:Multidrug and toxin extrusion protein n=1 Tax=Cyprinodon variegatus TaxID=28743 RepID=A0A3Q2CH36_CYPVA|nr:PREDICTED: multidrug and toxin extrusion protein 1-like [Cyprinodon variegatus]
MERPGSLEPAPPLPGAEPVALVHDAKMEVPPVDKGAEFASSKLFWCACVKRWLPLAYREELYHVLRLTGPLLLSRILNFLLQFVITIFCGHIGNAELAGYAVASATISVTTTATGYGLTTACDTLISQTYGSGNMKRVGAILQKSILILLLFCLLCWALLVNSHNLLLLLHQEQEVARIAHLYIMIFLPAVPAMFLHQLQVSYLQNQGIILPQMYTAAVANIFNLGINFLLINVLKLGVIGSAVANSLSQMIICLLLFGYIWWKKLHQQTWGGWSTECLQGWGAYMKLAIPSAFMICFEWWVWEVGGFLAGWLGEADLAAQHVMVEIAALTYMFPLGVHVAACVRVGNALGAGNTSRAIVTCKVALVLSGGLAVFQGFILAGCKSFVGKIFTSDAQIIQLVSNNLTVYVFLQFLDAVLCVCNGILVGCGRQKIAAVSNLVSYYFIGLPVGVALMFWAQLRVLGLWLGLLICVFIQTGFFLIIIFKTDWKKVTDKAQKRAGKTVVVPPVRPVSTVLNEAILPDVIDCPDSAQEKNETAFGTEGYSRVNTHDQELKGGYESEENPRGAAVPERDAEKSKECSVTKSPDRLSTSQLIMRRGLTLLSTVLILITGVAFQIAFPVPEPHASNMANFTLNWANYSTPTPLNALNPTTSL